MSADEKLQALQDEIALLKATALENQSTEAKIIEDLQSKIEEEMQLAMDLDQAKSETRRLQKNVAVLQESVSEHRAMVRAAEDDKEEEEFEAELNSEVKRHQTLTAARENAVDALAAVSEALQLSEIEDGNNSGDGTGNDGGSDNIDVDELLNMMKKQSLKEEGKESITGDSDDDSDEEVNLDDDKSFNSSIVAQSNDNDGDRQGLGTKLQETTSPELGGIRSISTDDEGSEGRSMSRDGDSFSSFMLSHATHPSGGGGMMESLDEQGRDAPEILKRAHQLKQSASVVAARTATARGTLARLLRLIKVYIDLLPTSTESSAGASSVQQQGKKEDDHQLASLLESVMNVEIEGGIDVESTWMQYHLNKNMNDEKDDTPLWLNKLLDWTESYQQNPSSLFNEDELLKREKKEKKETKKVKGQESRLNRQFYSGVELNDEHAFIEAQTNALVTLARRSGCFTSIVGSRYTMDDSEPFIDHDDHVHERERQQQLLKQRFKDAEEDDEDDELNLGGVLICHAYEWQSWGLFNKGGRWSGLREDLPSPLSSLLPPPTLENTIVSTSSSLNSNAVTAGGTGRNRSSSQTPSMASGDGGGGGSRRRSSNTFFALRGLGELYTDIHADTSVSFNPTTTNEDDDGPIGAVGMNWQWLDSWHVDSFTTPESIKALHETKKDKEEAEKLKKLKREEEEKRASSTSSNSPSSGNKPKYNFKSSSSFDELDQDQESSSPPLSYLTDQDGWQYAIESKEGIIQLCSFEGLTTCGMEEGIAGRPARQLRRRRWSRPCQLSGLKTQSNPWPDLFQVLVSNKKHWMNNNDGNEMNEQNVNVDGILKEDNSGAGAVSGEAGVDGNDEGLVPTLPNSVIGEWSRILKLQHRLAKCSLSVQKYSHALTVAQTLELEASVEAMSNKRKQKAYHDALAEKQLLDKNLKKLERTMERAKHDARNEKRLRDAILAQAEAEAAARPKTSPSPS